MNVSVKRLSVKDMDDIMLVENACWPGELRAKKEQFMSRLLLFGEGFIGAYNKNNLIGVATSMILRENTKSSWEGITQSGYCINHDNEGKYLYVVSLGVMTEFQGIGVGSKLLRSLIHLARKRNLSRVLVGARCPGYHSNKNLDIFGYLNLKNSRNEKIDPELRFYERNGFVINKIIPHFMKGDAESSEYGVLMSFDLTPNK